MRTTSRRPLLLLAVILGGLVPAFVYVAKPLHALATSAYETAVLADSPSVYYRLGESSGTTANDDSGNGHNATYDSSTTLGYTPSATVPSDTDTAISLSSTFSTPPASRDDSVLPTGDSARTAEVWFKTTSTFANGGMWLMDWGSYQTYSYNHYFGFTIHDANHFWVYEGSGGGNITRFKVLKTLNDGNWHVVDLTFDPSKEGSGNPLSLYVDGGLENTGAFPDTPPINTDSGATLAIGSDYDGSASFDGQLDEAAVYPSVLSASHIAAHFDANLSATAPSATAYSKAVNADSPAAYYRLGETSGSKVAADSSTHGVNARYEAGTLGGTPGATLTDSNTAYAPSTSTVSLVRSSTGLPTGDADRSLEMWLNTTDATDSQVLVSHGSFYEGDPNHWLGISLNPSNVINISEGENYPSANYVAFTPTQTLTDGHWHLLDLTFDHTLEGSGNPVSLYVDGSYVGHGTFPDTGPINTDATSLTVGSEGEGAYPFHGKLDDFAIYPTALPATRIKAHWMASGNSPGLTGGALTSLQMGAGGKPYCIACHGGELRVGGATKYPINTENGEFWHDFTDVTIPGRGYPLDFTRTYSSLDAATNGPLGYGWMSNTGMSLALTGSTPHRVATITQENGSQATFDEPASGNVWTATAPRFIATLTYNSGSSTWTFVRQKKDTFTFNSSGQLTAATDLNGNTTTYGYTSSKLSSITDAASRSLSVNWTGSNITSVVDTNVTPNRTVTYTYDGSGNLTDVTDVNGGDTHFAYDGSHRITTMKDPVCQALGGACPGVQNHYDGNGRIDWQKDQLNRETAFAYAGDPQVASGGTTTITDPSGNVVVDGYVYGVRTFTTSGAGTADAATSYFQYDPDTLALTGVLEPNGSLTTYTVDGSGNPLTVTDPLGRVTTKTYNSFNEVLTSQDPKGVTTTLTYDGNGNLTGTSTPLSGGSCTCQVVTYNHANGSFPGDVTSVVDPNGKTTYFHYDSHGYQDQVKDPLGHVTGTQYNAIGWVTNSWTPKAGCTWNSSTPTGCSSTYKTVYGYASDKFGDVQTITDPLSHVTTLGYDADRRKTSVEDGNSNTTSYTFDKAGQLTTTTRPDSTTQVTDYNNDGTVLDQKDGKGNAILTYGYDHRGDVKSSTDALSNATYYTYDLNNNVTSKSQGSSDITYAYDGANQLCWQYLASSVSGNGCASPPGGSSTYSYDSDGQKTGMVDATGTSSWSIDQLHRLTAYTNGAGKTVTYGYGADLKNQVATIAYPNSVGTVTQTWNDDGTLASVEDWNSKTTTFNYDANANETSQVVPSTTNVTDTFGFNAADQMTSVSDSNGSTLFSANYTRDSNGQLSSDSSQASNQANYKYTSLNQLCYAGSGTSNACSSPPASSYPYAFDSADNLTTNNGNSQQFNNADALCWSLPSGTSANACGSVPTGATSYGYDNSGNRSSTVPNAGSATCNTYDQANRLTAIKTGTGSTCTSPTTVGTYAYDGGGVRQSKAVSGTTTQYTWGGSMLLQEKAGSANPVSYLYGPGGAPFEQINGSTTTYLHHDQLGSTRLISDSAGATGTATTITYGPYGAVVSTSGSLTTNLMFQGQYLDAESGLYYLRARYYDPTTAQFLTRDPLVAQTRSPYAYVAGNPLNASDPTGLGSTCYGGPSGLICLDSGNDVPVTTGPTDLGNAEQGAILGGLTDLGNALGDGLKGCLGLSIFNWGNGAVHSDVGNILMPGGQPIGEPGSRPGIRIVPPGQVGQIGSQLGGTGTLNTPPGYPGTGFDLPGGGWIGTRPTSGSGGPALDINVPGIPIDKLHEQQ